MRFVRHDFHLVLLTATLLAVASAPAASAVTQLTVTALDKDGAYWFSVGASEERNPPITLPPGEEVEVFFQNAGSQPHTLHFGGPIDESSEFIHPGGSTTLSFRVPPSSAIDESTFEYWCDPHKFIGMRGPLILGEAPEEAVGEEPSPDTLPGHETTTTPGAGAAAAAAAIATAAGYAFIRDRRRGD